jgi:hypothetical protein
LAASNITVDSLNLGNAATGTFSAAKNITYGNDLTVTNKITTVKLYYKRRCVRLEYITADTYEAEYQGIRHYTLTDDIIFTH